MSYITLYRKYRPQIFDEIIGQDHVIITLKNAVENEKVSHAYLFCGMRGTGKTSTAKILAKAINCKEGPTPKPCGECSNCIAIKQGSAIDVLEIDAASNRGINEIRELREKVSFAPVNCHQKVYIIDEVHMLTPEASNALLKMMEEPPEHVIFILATTEPHKVLPTILSRCQRFDFKRVSNDEIVKRLDKIAKKEKMNINDACLNLISKQSQGSVRDAIGVLDQLGSYSVKEIKEEDVLNLLNIYEDDLLFDFTDCIIKRETAQALKLANKIIDSGRDLRHFVNSLIEHFREIFLLISTKESEKMIAKSRQSIERLKEQAQSLELWEALKAIDLLSECSSQMRWSEDTRLLFEIALVKLTKIEADLSLEGLLYRVEELEKMINAGQKTEEETVSTSNLPDGSQGQVKKKGQKTKKTKINIEKIERLWPIILEQVKKQSIPVYSLVLQCHPIKISNDEITIEFNKRAEFHLKEIEKAINMDIVSKSITQVMGKKYKIDCVLGDGKKNKEEDKKEKKENNLSPDHAVRLVKDTFGAEVIEESSYTDKEG